MRDRRKRNIIIGSLCCLLVFMGIGYALLSQTLNINGMATMTGEWKIFIDSITVKETGGSAKSNTAEVSEDKMGASFDVELLKPGDYVEYDVVVKNEGTINAVLRELVPNIESNNMDILLTHSIIQGQILKAESETKFTLKIRFDERATEIVSGGKTTFDIQMVYEQYDGDAESIDPSMVPVTANDCFTINDNGVITDYDYSCGTYVTVPAVVNGTTVTEISNTAFTVANAILYFDENGADYPSIVVAKDSDTYTKFQILLEQMGEEASVITLLLDGQELPDTTGLVMMKANILETGDMTLPISEVEYLDLSQASGLTKIAEGAFFGNENDPKLKYLNLDGVSIEAIGNTAFDYTDLKELTLNTDLYAALVGNHHISVDTLRIYPGTTTVITGDIGYYDENRITINKLIIEEGITEIDRYVFGSTYAVTGINSVELPVSLEKIGSNAFSNAGIKSLTIKKGSKLKEIGFHAFAGLKISTLDLSPLAGHVEIGESAFSRSDFEKVVIEDATIDRSAFSSNEKLTHLELIGDIEFSNTQTVSNLNNLETVIIKSDTIKTIISDRYNRAVFADSPIKTLKFLNRAGTDINSSIEEIQGWAFNSATPSELILPTSLKTIGDNAFAAANPTTLVMSPVMKNIGQFAFNNLTIESLTIPSTIEKIRNGAFASMPETSTIIIQRENEEGILFGETDGMTGIIKPWNGSARVIYQP